MSTVKLKRYFNFNQSLFFILALLSLYAPVKDIATYLSRFLARPNIEIINASFGTSMPWQTQEMSYVKVSQQIRPSFAKSQIIYTRLRLENPTPTSQTYRKIWLNFDHKNGSREYTTDYTLYNADTRQRLIGQSVRVGPKSSVDVIATYRFVPSFEHQTPETMNMSWEGKNLMRHNACSYDIRHIMTNNFQNKCEH